MKNNKKTTLFIISVLAIIFAYNIYNYIDKRICEYEEQFIVYQKQVDLYEDNISSYKDELIDIRNELHNIQEELDDLKNKISNNVEEDVVNFKEQLKNLPTNNNTQSNTSYSKLYVGRLYIPSVDINVALYDGWEQEITDRKDSANYFQFYLNRNDKIIADHNYQEFSKLFNVKVGTTGYIEFNDGHIKNIECIKVLSGHNTKTDITDKNGNSLIGKNGYLMYTCQNGWENIHICLWKDI